MKSRRNALTVTALVALLAVSALAQQAQQGQGQQPVPWSEQPPMAQGPLQGSPQGMPPQAPRPGFGGPQQPQMDNDGDAPERGVARISSITGNVSVRRGDSADLVAAILNAPLTVNDRVVTAEGSRAEVQFDSGNLIRLGPSTEIRLSELQYGHYQIELATGTTIFREAREGAQVEISTPSIAVHPLKKGVYRVTVGQDGTSEITVRGGDADVSGPHGSEELHTGTMQVRGPATDPEFQTISAIPSDDFEHWSMSRDQQMERSPAPRNVNPDITGAEDLDQYGRWANDGSYGQVWVPTADPGWAPYRCGRWVWTDFYGWTWVGCEPWAWAPYHYGRWYYGSLGWAWWPGPAFGHAYYRPALVGFFGWGGVGIGVGFGGGFGFGNVGWVPLAPYERFRPWYGAGARGLGVVNNVNVAGVYRNARVANGVTSMQAQNFGRGSVSNANFVRAGAGDLARAGAVRGSLPVSPSAESRQFSNRSANTQGMPRTSENTRFFSRNIPSQSNRGVGAGGSNNGGWQRFNPSASGQGSRAGSATAPYGNRGMSPGGPQSNARPSATQGYAPRSSPQQVRISPSIVQNRGNSGSPTPSSGGGRSSSGSRGSSGGKRSGSR